MHDIIYGIHVIKEILDTCSNQLIHIFFQQNRQDLKFKNLIFLARQNNIPIKFATRKWLTKIIKYDKHQGVIAYVKSFNILKENYLSKILEKKISYFFLIIDNINDPRNLGSCIRSAYLAGAHAIIIKKDRSSKITPTVKKVSSGSVYLIPIIQVINLTRTIKLLKKYSIKVIGTSNTSQKNLYCENLNHPIALVVGSEEKGISNLIQKNCDYMLKIPVINNKFPLNVSVATGICLFEIIRQKYYNKLTNN
ncbi:MAG: 23S rRNA (guanosine(2251)-2'-O)-methyltransferase RlmB [Wigglesworthia glossinidia]|nr:23S rRNA (guanosine(2251)-2'-O)-methyltransferase RlmB [Wigglesworthia glossinidia]